jgi:protein TonB
MPDSSFDLSPNEGRWPGIVFVILLHAAALWGLWQYEIIPTPQELASTLFVNFIAPPAPKPEEPKPPQPKPHPVEKPRDPHPHLVAQTPVVAPTDHVAPPMPEPAPPAPPAPAVAAPVQLGSELSLACPQRTPPVYPPFSRRLGEAGVVVVRVELDEQGRVASAQVKTSSGYLRLDEAALTAVKTWRCTPATRNGQPVRAIALQPFNFILQGN